MQNRIYIIYYHIHYVQDDWRIHCKTLTGTGLNPNIPEQKVGNYTNVRSVFAAGQSSAGP